MIWLTRLPQSDRSSLHLTCLTELYLTRWHLPLPPCCSLLLRLSSLVLLLLQSRLALVRLLAWNWHPHLTRLWLRPRCAPPHIVHLRLLRLTRLTVEGLSLAHLHLTWLILRYLATLTLRRTVGPNLHLADLGLWHLRPH